MRVVICRNDEEAGEVAAEVMATVCRTVGPEVVLGIATGSSPLTAYAALARRATNKEIDLSRASAFALDEYVGLPAGHPESYAETIRRTVTEPLNLDPGCVHAPDGSASDLVAAAEHYEKLIRDAGGVHAQIVGVGSNGHIGFNEPGSSLASRTRSLTLTERTRQDNARFFDSIDEVPTRCLTQGLGTIMAAHTIVMVATGEHKAPAIAGVVEGPVTAFCPGSVLQFHPDVTVVVDEAAASQLRLAGYFREAYPVSSILQTG